MTDWGQSLALVYELRRETRRLGQENERLLAALARVVEGLEREARRLPVQPIQPSTRAPGGRHGPDGSPRP